MTTPIATVNVADVPAGPDVSTRSVSDGELARRIATASPGNAGTEEAELYRRFAPRVRLYGIRHLRDEAAAQDLAQDVLFVAIERLRAGQVRKPDEIGSFILGTSRVMAGALKRTERRRQALIERFDWADRVEPPSGPELDLNRVERCLQALGERDRTVLILCFYAEKTSNEIARDLGLTSGAVRTVRHRALDRLRQCVEPRTAE